MTLPFKHGMAEATRLTRAGKLREATDLIRSLLNPAAKPARDGTAFDGQTIDGTVIDGTVTETTVTGTAARGPFGGLPNQPPPQAPASPRKAGRTPLGETLRRIASGGMPAHGPLAAAPVPGFPEARFLSLTHTGPAGSRGYRLYVPAHHGTGPLPLVVMLHGCTQTPEDFAAGTGMNALAEEFGCLIAYPSQPSGANAQKCWNWFRPEDQARNRGEPALIVGIVRDIARNHNADPSRIYVAGLSAGGAAAAILAATYPDVFAAAGVHSGLPAGSAGDVMSAFAAMRSGATAPPHPKAVPTIALHGLADQTVHPGNGAAVVAQALRAMPGLRRAIRQDRSAGGREVEVITHHHVDGRTMAEHWQIADAGHAWAGGRAEGSYTDPAGPDASRQMMRFFLQHRLP